MTHLSYAAVDLGAESGRVMVGNFDGKCIQLKEVHRFLNGGVRLRESLHWDVLRLWSEIKTGLSQAGARPGGLRSIGLDTWGVDFGLLGSDGKLLGNPVHYRDARTDKIHDYSNRVMNTRQVFEATAAEPWAISSLFQLLAMQREQSPLLPLAKDFLNIPDLFNYFLTGVKASNRTCTFWALSFA